MAADTYEIGRELYIRLGHISTAIFTTARLAETAAIADAGITSETARLLQVIRVLAETLEESWQFGIDYHVDRHPEEDCP